MELRSRPGATCLLGFSFLLLIISSDGHIGLGKDEESKMGQGSHTAGKWTLWFANPRAHALNQYTIPVSECRNSFEDFTGEIKLSVGGSSHALLPETEMNDLAKSLE